MNSFKFSKEAIVQEINNQLEYRINNNKPKQEQLTVKWNENSQQIEIMRKKEQINDYRIMPEPDIPLINIKDIRDEVIINTEILPFTVEKRLIEETNLTIKEIQFFSQDTKRSAILFGANEKINDIELVAKILINSLKENEYSNACATTISDMLFSYINNEYFSHTMLQSYIQKSTIKK